MNFSKLVGLACLSLLPVHAYAFPVVYTIMTTGEVSSLGSITNSTLPITFTGTADTANLQETRELQSTGPHGSTIYINVNSVQLTTLAVRIGNSSPATFLSPPSLIYAYAEEVSFSDSNGHAAVGYDVPTLPTTPDILASVTVTPITLPNYAFEGTVATDKGTLTVAGSPTGYTTRFSVTSGVAVPEPSSAAVVAISLAGLAYARRKLRR